MNKLIPKIGSAIVTASVFLFSFCMIVDYPFGSYLVCMFLPIGYIRVSFRNGHLRYHPEGGLHKIANWKVSSGKRGKHQYDMDGKEVYFG